MEAEMALSDKEFEEYLALYGSDVEGWPEKIRQDTNNMGNRFVSEHLIKEYGKLETKLNKRRFEPASAYFIERIILAAAQRKQQNIPKNIFIWLQELFADFMMPKPSYAVVLLLVLGISIGAGVGISENNSIDDTQEFIQANLFDDGAIL